MYNYLQSSTYSPCLISVSAALRLIAKFVAYCDSNLESRTDDGGSDGGGDGEFLPLDLEAAVKVFLLLESAELNERRKKELVGLWTRKNDECTSCILALTARPEPKISVDEFIAWARTIDGSILMMAEPHSILDRYSLTMKMKTNVNLNCEYRKNKDDVKWLMQYAMR